MILEKIPRIECILTIPEFITDDITSMFKEFSCQGKSLKILKKYKKRIKTYNYARALIENKTGLQENEYTNNEYEIISKIFTNPNNFDKFSSMESFNALICSLEPNDKHVFTKFIIGHIDKIINKYIKILIHIDDQVYVLSKQNKDNKKIFLKFFLPKIQKKNESETTKELDSKPQFVDGSINSLKDNIHVTFLPTVEGHGLDGLFHLTFRIEGKKNVVFEFSKFASLNIDSNKLAVGIYPDEKCLDALIFKIIENLPKLVEIIKLKEFTKFNNEILNLYNYSNMIEFLTLEILNQLKLTNKLEYIIEKYFFSLGKETIKSIIDKLFKIVIFTFIELYYGIS